jgi:hypothetical protein
MFGHPKSKNIKMEVSTSPKDGNGNPTVFCREEATATVLLILGKY